MEVILLERIERLGIIGDVVNVKPGYARNYLLPQRKALRATKENLAHFESQKTQIEANNVKHREEAEKISSKIAETVLVIIRQAGESGHLYGSVTAKDISDVLGKQNIHVNRQQVKIEHPIKMLGLHDVRVALHPEVSVKIIVNVAKSEDEAETQLQAKTRSSGEQEKSPTSEKAKGKKVVSEAETEEEKSEDSQEQ